jgi:hypothetical protein
MSVCFGYLGVHSFDSTSLREGTKCKTIIDGIISVPAEGVASVKENIN